MKIFRSTTLNIALLALSMVLVSACGGGGGGGGDTPTKQTIGGIVSDPAIKGATVTLYDTQGAKVGTPTTSGIDGGFTFNNVPLGVLSGYHVRAKGGVDTQTGEDLNGIELSLLISLFNEDKYKSLVVSPLTSMLTDNPTVSIEAMAKQLGHGADKFKQDPTSSAGLAKTSMKLMLMRQEGVSFSNIYAGLAGNNGLGSNDLAGINIDDKKARLLTHFALIDSANTTQELKNAYQKALILRTVKLALATDLKALDPPNEQAIKSNLLSLASHLITHLPSGISYLTPADVIATISAGNGFLSADDLNDPASSFNHFIVKLVDRDATFSDTLKLTFYDVKNPLTGNDQLVVYDAVKGEQKVIKTDVILGNRAFVFSGVVEGDKTVFKERKYGIFLDPSQSKEIRTGQGRFGEFEYDFYFDNSFKRYDIASPKKETVIFDSSKLPQGLKNQKMKVLDGAYTLFNNISDADNSYVELKAFEALADVLKGEFPSGKLHTPLIVRMQDSAVIQGHMVRILKNAQGKTEGVLTFFDAVHKKGSYPSGSTNKKRLRLSSPTLSSCDNIAGADGAYFFQAENNEYVYLAKDGSDIFYAYKKSDKSLTAVTGVKYPASYNHKIHNIGRAAHGSGTALTSGFPNLSGANNALSDGQNAYIKINYDGDASDPVGKYKFLGKIHVFKHFQVLKLTGTTGVKMLDNGDGIDHADDSDTENVVGHGNLIAVNNGRLFIEIGNYEGATNNGGTCTPSSFGYGCSSIEYGYMNTNSVNKTALDKILKPKKLLRYFVSRRIAPFALGNKLYISVFKGDPGELIQPYVFTLNIHSLASPDTATSTIDGRTYFTKTAERATGVFEGAVLAWDGANGQIKNLTTGVVMGQSNGSGSVIPGDPAINSISGNTHGVPLAGIGSLFALKADPGGHTWYLQVGDVDKENGLEYIDRVPFSNWLYQ